MILLLLDICSLDSTVLLQILFEILNIDAVDLSFQKVIIWPNLSIILYHDVTHCISYEQMSKYSKQCLANLLSKNISSVKFCLISIAPIQISLYTVKILQHQRENPSNLRIPYE